MRKESWPGGVAGRAPDLAASCRRWSRCRPRRSSRRPCTGASGCGCSGRRSGRRSGSRRPLRAGRRSGVRGDLALEDLARPRQALGVVGVGVGGQDHLAGREAEVHLADQLEHRRPARRGTRRRSGRTRCRRRSGRCSRPAAAAPARSARSRRERCNAVRPSRGDLSLERDCRADRIRRPPDDSTGGPLRRQLVYLGDARRAVPGRQSGRRSWSVWVEMG